MNKKQENLDILIICNNLIFLFCFVFKKYVLLTQTAFICSKKGKETKKAQKKFKSSKEERKIFTLLPIYFTNQALVSHWDYCTLVK